VFAYVGEWQDERNGNPTRRQFLKFVTDMHFKVVRERKKKYRCYRDRQTDRRTDRRPDLIHSNIYIYKNVGN
jgi:hypothetical protein